MDYGPEMSCNVVAGWRHFNITGSEFIEPGAPWSSTFVESFNGTFRDQPLTVKVFHSLLEAKAIAED